MITYNLQLALPRNRFDRCPSITQTYLTTLNLSHKPNLLKAVLHLSGSPDFSNELVTWLYRAGESGLELPHITRITATDRLEQPMGSKIPAGKSVHDSTTKAHLLSRFRGSVKGIIVTI